MKRLNIFFSALMYCLTTCAMDVAETRKLKFDELPAITSYDKHSPAILPPSWKGKFCNTNSEIIALLPKPIAQYCIKNPWGCLTVHFLQDLTDFLCERSITKGKIMSSVKNIYFAAGYFFSPQTKFNFNQTFLHIIHGTAVDTQDPRLTYNQMLEIENKHALVDQLPIILKDLILQTDIGSDHVTHKIINPLYKTSRNGKQIGESTLYYIYDFIKKHNDNQRSWYFRAISPQTAIDIASDYKNRKPGQPYNLQKELNNFASLINQFPAELSVEAAYALDSYHHHCIWRLAFIAQWLKTPFYGQVLIDYNHELEKHIETICQAYGTPSTINTDTVIKTFVATFGPLTYCYDQLTKQIKTTRSDMDNQLKMIVNRNFVTIRSSHEDEQLKVLSLDTITEKLKEDLPSCSICFELFSDHFRHANGGRRTHIEPCNHVFCSKCLADQSITTCPMCRVNIEGTVPPINDVKTQ